MKFLLFSKYNTKNVKYNKNSINNALYPKSPPLYNMYWTIRAITVTVRILLINDKIK